jgi:hypothetical protein
MRIEHRDHAKSALVAWTRRAYGQVMSNGEHRPGPDADDDARLGGRLDLLSPEQLTTDQRQLYDRLSATRIARAKDAGYQAALPDGRLIGPFNAFLRVPPIGAAQVEWAQAISAAGLPAGLARSRS